jgi:hypothetical protein
MFHNFQHPNDGFYHNCDNDICTKCDHSRVYLRSLDGTACKGREPERKTLSSVLEGLKAERVRKIQEQDIRYVSLATFIVDNGFVAFTYPTNSVVSLVKQGNDVLQAAHDAKKEVKRLTDLIEAIEKYS